VSELARLELAGAAFRLLLRALIRARGDGVGRALRLLKASHAHLVAVLEKHALHLIEDNPRQGTVLLDVLEERFESRAAIARVAVDRDGRDELE